MLEIRTEIHIAAVPQRVWDVLMDFPGHAAWNPFVRSVSGTPAVGERLQVRIQPPGGKGMGFRPRVLAARPAQEFRWHGQLLLPGLFDGEHFFQLRPHEGGTHFVHGERFTGLLVPLARRSLEGATRAGFEAMNRALKAQAEAA